MPELDAVLPEAISRAGLGTAVSFDVITARLDALEDGDLNPGTIDAARRHGAVGDNQKASAAANTAAIQAAIDEAADYHQRPTTPDNKPAGVVYLPPGEYFVNGLKLKTQVTLCGAGPSTVIRLNDDLDVPIISLNSANNNHTNLRNLRLRGNKYGNGGTAAHGILYETNEEAGTVDENELYTFHGDAQHRIYNVTIDACSGDGIRLFTRECHVAHVMIGDCARNGIRVQGSDNFFGKVICNWIGIRGFWIEGGNQTLVGCKVWYIGTDATQQECDGFRIDSSRNLLVACQAQDVSRNGFWIRGGDHNIFAGCVADNIGNWFDNTGLGFDHGATPDVAAVRIERVDASNSANYNNIHFNLAQRSGSAFLRAAVLINQSCEYNTVSFAGNPSHVRAGENLTIIASTAGAHNTVYENGHRITGPAPSLANDATPSVLHLGEVILTNTGATTVTALDDGKRGQEVLVKFGSADFTVDFTGTTLKGNGGVDWTPASGDAMVCKFDGTNWFCSIIDVAA